jgi:hypothetical protein
MPTKRRSNKTTKTLRNQNNKRTGNKSSYSPQHIVTMFLQMLNTVKLYHWKTSNYAEHKATDE